MSALASFVAGRRTKWVVLAIWVVLLVALAPLGSKLADETQDDTASFLPESAESTEVVEILDEEFSAGETTQGLLIYYREGGLTPADEDKILEDAEALDALSEEELPLTAPPIVPVGDDAPEESSLPRVTSPTPFSRFRRTSR